MSPGVATAAAVGWINADPPAIEANDLRAAQTVIELDLMKGRPPVGLKGRTGRRL